MNISLYFNRFKEIPFILSKCGRVVQWLSSCLTQKSKNSCLPSCISPAINWLPVQELTWTKWHSLHGIASINKSVKKLSTVESV